jgi:hypothetical protein
MTKTPIIEIVSAVVVAAGSCWAILYMAGMLLQSM